MAISPASLIRPPGALPCRVRLGDAPEHAALSPPGDGGPVARRHPLVPLAIFPEKTLVFIETPKVAALRAIAVVIVALWAWERALLGGTKAGWPGGWRGRLAAWRHGGVTQLDRSWGAALPGGQRGLRRPLSDVERRLPRPRGGPRWLRRLQHRLVCHRLHGGRHPPEAPAPGHAPPLGGGRRRNARGGLWRRTALRLRPHTAPRS